MVSKPQINIGEDGSTPQLVKQVINHWQWILILDGHLIEFSIIYA
jgi:hypothetical protein